MRINDFDLYKDLLKEKSGLDLGPDKAYLIDSRLTPVAKKWGYDNIDNLSMALRGVSDPKLVQDVVEAMTTNETFFFRDTKPFTNFEQIVLPHILQTRQTTRKLRIWCAACSTGQEPYSLAMILKDRESEMKGWNIEILATDLSTEVLETAEKAQYTQFEVQRGLPIQMLMNHFEQQGDKWHLKPDIKKMVKFKPLNLLENFKHLGTFDIIFCRNVLIYFDKETKAGVLHNLADILNKDGFLFLGGAESVIGITDAFKPAKDGKGVYIHKENTQEASAMQENQNRALAT